MTRALYTPGPWFVARTYHGKPASIQPTDKYKHLTLTGSGGAKSYTRDICKFEMLDEDEANALLIAAAPELLEALKRFTKHGFFHATDLTVEDFVFANAAIAKAQGDGQ